MQNRQSVPESLIQLHILEILTPEQEQDLNAWKAIGDNEERFEAIVEKSRKGVRHLYEIDKKRQPRRLGV